MNGTQTTPPVAVALEHITGPARGAMTWLSASTLDVTLDDGCLVHISEARSSERSSEGSSESSRGGDDSNGSLVARLHRTDGTYEIETPAGKSVWVNGQRVTAQRLNHGDTVEFGETGPLCRCRFYTEHSSVSNTVGDIVSDIFAYLKVSRQPMLRRCVWAVTAFFGRLTHETSIFFRLTLLVAIISFGVLAYQQTVLNAQLRESINNAAARLDTVGMAMINAEKDAIHASDLKTLRDSLQSRVTMNLSRLEELEQRSTATRRVIRASGPSVVLVLGTYGFREIDGDRFLRRAVTEGGFAALTPLGRPQLSLDGDGPTIELQFTGTGFFVGNDGTLVTNRHVALPWEQDAGSGDFSSMGVEPVMRRLAVYRMGNPRAEPVQLLIASDNADLALLQLSTPTDPQPGLELAQGFPAPGAEVVLMGFPTGLRSILAQSGAEFVAELQAAGALGFWDIADRLAQRNYISPLSSRGIVGQVTQATIVYDAETTHGGSGGPLLDINGRVIAINTAILPEFGGSNLGVPVAKLHELLAIAGLDGYLSDQHRGSSRFGPEILP